MAQDITNSGRVIISVSTCPANKLNEVRHSKFLEAQPDIRWYWDMERERSCIGRRADQPSKGCRIITKSLVIVGHCRAFDRDS